MSRPGRRPLAVPDRLRVAAQRSLTPGPKRLTVVTEPALKPGVYPMTDPAERPDPVMAPGPVRVFTAEEKAKLAAEMQAKQPLGLKPSPGKKSFQASYKPFTKRKP